MLRAKSAVLCVGLKRWHNVEPKSIKKHDYTQSYEERIPIHRWLAEHTFSELRIKHGAAPRPQNMRLGFKLWRDHIILARAVRRCVLSAFQRVCQNKTAFIFSQKTKKRAKSKYENLQFVRFLLS